MNWRLAIMVCAILFICWSSRTRTPKQRRCKDCVEYVRNKVAKGHENHYSKMTCKACSLWFPYPHDNCFKPNRKFQGDGK